LIPVRELKLHFEVQPSLEKLWHPDFIAHASFKNL